MLLNYFHAILLGIVEGATEFIPVSSTGHLILAEDALDFSIASAKMFIVVIQLGAILAVCWLYRQKLLDVAFNLHKKPQQLFVTKLLVAFLPAAVMGLAFHHIIEEKLFSPLVVAITMFLGGFVILAIEKLKPAPITHTIEDMTMKQAFGVGCAQIAALIPGTSRSGATIMGGLLLELDRKVATEFSFFLAIPVMVAATGLDVLKYYNQLTPNEIGVIAVGFITSFFAGLAAVKFLVAFVSRHDFMVFAIYRILFGALMLVYYWL